MVFGALLVGSLGVLAARRGYHAYRRTVAEMEQERSMNNYYRSSHGGRSHRGNYYSNYSRYY